MLLEVAGSFCPPYEIEEGKGPGIRLRDPAGARPSIFLRHRYEKRLFLRATYLAVSVKIPGSGPKEPAELTVRIRGPLSRQRATVSWRHPIDGGDIWKDRLGDALNEAVNGVEAVQSASATWSPTKGEWSIRLETMSGSLVSGMMAAMPIAVPFERREASSIVDLVDGFQRATR